MNAIIENRNFSRHPGHGAGTPGGQGEPGASAATGTPEISPRQLAFLELLGFSVGRIVVSFNQGEGTQMAGTAWLIGPDLAVTSRHVVLHPASGFSSGVGRKPPIQNNFFGEPARVEIDFGPAKVGVKAIEWVETLENDVDSPDLAFLRLERKVEKAHPLALGRACEGQRIAVIQYPLYADAAKGDPPLDHPGEEHVTTGLVVGFDGGRSTLDHTAETFGGSSGSPVIDWDALAVVGMHSGSKTEAVSRAVLASAIEKRLAQLQLLAH